MYRPKFKVFSVLSEIVCIFKGSFIASGAAHLVRPAQVQQAVGEVNNKSTAIICARLSELIYSSLQISFGKQK